MAASQQTAIIAEDDAATLQSLEKMLSQAGLKVVRYKNNTTLRKSGHLDGVPCVLILGDGMGVDFLAVLKKVKWEMPVIFLHSGNSVSEAVKAIQAGADDYLTKPFSEDQLLKSVRRALKRATERAQTTLAKQELTRRAAQLTQREWDIINLMMTGMLNKQIAEHLGLALVTIKVHRGSAMRKLGARTAAELARIVHNAGISPNNSLVQVDGQAILERRSR